MYRNIKHIELWKCIVKLFLFIKIYYIVYVDKLVYNNWKKKKN